MDGEVGCVAGMMFRTGEGGSIRGCESNRVATGFWRGFFWRFLVVFSGGRIVLGREFCFLFFFLDRRVILGMVVAGLMVGDIVDILLPSYFIEIVDKTSGEFLGCNAR